MTELFQAAKVRSTAVILVVATQFRIEHLLLVFQRRMKVFPAPHGDSKESSPQAL
jgi:hypothetical protein